VLIAFPGELIATAKKRTPDATGYAMIIGPYLENSRWLIRDLRLTKEERILDSSSLSESNKARL